MAIDLFCGLGGWAEGLLAEGYDVVGFDIERRPYPADLVLQDAATIDGAQFRDARLIVASPPCTEYSYMAMPWTRAKQIARGLRGEDDFPEGYKGSRTVEELNRLFNACFRIQREASAAAGRHIPMVVENVRGAVPWVGPAQGKFGSFYVWGDVPALLPIAQGVGVKVPGISWNGYGEPGYKAEAFNFTAAQRMKSNPGTHARTEGPGRPRFIREGTKQGGTWFHDTDSISRCTSSKSTARKQESAEIAKIPFPLAQHIARVYAS